jgi:hypothetical protein
MPIVVIQPSATDTHLSSSNPNTNYGTGVGINGGEQVGFADIYRSLIKFDLSSIPPGSKVISAYFELYLTTDQSNVLTVYRLYRVKRAWVEGEATWNIYSTGNSWQTAGAAGDDDRESEMVGTWTMPSANPPLNEWYGTYLDIPSIEAMIDGAWSNNGWLLKAVTEVDDAFVFGSSEAVDTAARPRLTIDYIEPLGRLAKYRVNAILGKARLSTSLDRTINKAWLRYEETTLKRSTVQENAESQARYGIKEKVLSGGQLSTGVANQATITYLNYVADPSTPDVDLTLSADSVIRDQNEDRVPPEEVRPNNWGILEGLPRPSAAVPETLIQDPRMFYIEQIEYDEDQKQSRIRSGKDKFAENLINRLLGRS